MKKQMSLFVDEKNYSRTEWENRIEKGAWWVEDVYQCQIDSVDMSEWLKHETVIVVISLEVDIEITIAHGNKIYTREPLDVRMTLRCEKRGQMRQWYAYKRIHGVLRKKYLGHDEDIKTERIVDIAKKYSGLIFG